MATVALQNSETSFSIRAATEDQHGWGFVLLLTVVATLFIRPADLIPELENWPIYEFLIVACLVVSARASLRLLANRQLIQQPVLVCLLVLLVAIGVSHLSHGFFWAARMSMYEFGKLLLFYLLINALVNTPHRLQLFVRWLTISITSVAALALLDRYGILSVAALESIVDHGALVEGELTLIDRIRGTGIFQDPNDFGLILVTGLILNSMFLLKPGTGWLRYFWLVPGAILLVTFSLTHSRGAMLSLACAIPAALAFRRGWRFGAVSLMLLPLLAVFFSARMTDVDAMVAGTGQSRIQIWSESLTVWRYYPLFGLGEGLLVDELGVVAHNSFLHCFAELGGFGGTAFLACFLAASLGLWAVRHQYVRKDDACEIGKELRDLAHTRVFIFSALVAYVAGMLTISRQFVVPTYLILGLATSAHASHSTDTPGFLIGKRFLLASLVVSAAALLLFYIAVRVFVRW